MNEKAPADVGVPEIEPDVVRLKPGGNPGPTAQVSGATPPAAMSVTGPYACPTIPAGNGLAVVIANPEYTTMETGLTTLVWFASCTVIENW